MDVCSILSPSLREEEKEKKREGGEREREEKERERGRRDSLTAKPFDFFFNSEAFQIIFFASVSDLPSN